MILASVRLNAKVVGLWAQGLRALFRIYTAAKGEDRRDLAIRACQKAKELHPDVRREDQEMVLALLLEGYTPTLEEAQEVNDFYEGRTPLMDALKALITEAKNEKNL